MISNHLAFWFHKDQAFGKRWQGVGSMLKALGLVAILELHCCYQLHRAGFCCLTAVKVDEIDAGGCQKTYKLSEWILRLPDLELKDLDPQKRWNVTWTYLPPIAPMPSRIFLQFFQECGEALKDLIDPELLLVSSEASSNFLEAGRNAFEPHSKQSLKLSSYKDHEAHEAAETTETELRWHVQNLDPKSLNFSCSAWENSIQVPFWKNG